MVVSESAQAVRVLARFVADLDWQAVPERVRQRTLVMLTDFVGVTIAGSRTRELRALLDAWQPCTGPAAVLGAGRRCGPDDAAWLNGTAACALELDEGNKHAQGHPAAHVVPAALAELSVRDPLPGARFLAAVVTGYEVAARFGRAVRRRADLHPHGHWGAAGAGAAVARLRGLPADRIAAAIDTATGLVHVTPWSVVLGGAFVRNLWAAGANVAGLIGTRLAAAGLAECDGTAARTLGGIVGELDVPELTADLGRRWYLVQGYLKRHASCSYTHPAADAALLLRAEHGFDAADIERVTVDGNRLAMALAAPAAHSRVAAMFSVPYVVAVALVDGHVRPDAFDAKRRGDGRLLDLMRRIEVRHDPALDTRLPAERAGRVHVLLTDGRALVAEVPNPVGDADHLPFGPGEVRAKLDDLLGARTAALVDEVVAALPEAEDAAAVLARLP